MAHIFISVVPSVSPPVTGESGVLEAALGKKFPKDPMGG